MRLSFLFFVFVYLGFAQVENPRKRIRDTFESAVTEMRLDNGLTILVYEKHDAPVVITRLGFKVGAVDERSGNFGGTHMLEHMLFKGTENYGTKDFKKEAYYEEKIEKIGKLLDQEKRKEKPSELKIKLYGTRLKKLAEAQNKYLIHNPYSSVYSAHGAVGFNAYTSNDNTVYMLSVPANKLELWMLVEAERLKNPVFRTYYLERDVVVEERHMRTDGNPRGKLFEEFLAAAYKAHPYRQPVIGWMSEIEVLDKDILREFFDEYYVPNNCVMVLVGDVNPDEAKAMAEKYFGDWQPNYQLRRTNIIEPEQNGERYVKVREKAQPFLLTGYHMPRSDSREANALQIFSEVLTKGRTGLLYKRLVLEKKMASTVFTYAGGMPGKRHPSLFLLGAYPAAPHSSSDVLGEIDVLLEEIMEKGLDPVAVERVKKASEAQFVYALESHETIAGALIDSQLNYGSWREILDGYDLYLSLSPEEVLEVVKKILRPENRTVAEMVNIN
jgi:predicted Zn-dependent peptidase